MLHPFPLIFNWKKMINSKIGLKTTAEEKPSDTLNELQRNQSITVPYQGSYISAKGHSGIAEIRPHGYELGPITAAKSTWNNNMNCCVSLPHKISRWTKRFLSKRQVDVIWKTKCLIWKKKNTQKKLNIVNEIQRSREGGREGECRNLKYTWMDWMK